MQVRIELCVAHSDEAGAHMNLLQHHFCAVWLGLRLLVDHELALGVLHHLEQCQWWKEGLGFL